MKNYNKDHSQETLVNQDLDQLLQQCRTLHDQAVFDFFRKLIVRGQQLLKQWVSFSSQEDKVKRSQASWASSK
jgi:hypothetical protein